MAGLVLGDRRLGNQRLGVVPEITVTITPIQSLGSTFTDVATTGSSDVNPLLTQTFLDGETVDLIVQSRKPSAQSTELFTERFSTASDDVPKILATTEQFGVVESVLGSAGEILSINGSPVIDSEVSETISEGTRIDVLASAFSDNSFTAGSSDVPVIDVLSSIQTDQFSSTVDGQVVNSVSDVFGTGFTQTFDGTIVTGVSEEILDEVFTTGSDGDSVLISAVSFDGQVADSNASSEPGAISIGGNPNSPNFDIIHRENPILAGTGNKDSIVGEERLGEARLSGVPFFFGEAFTEGSSVGNIPFATAVQFGNAFSLNISTVTPLLAESFVQADESFIESLATGEIALANASLFTEEDTEGSSDVVPVLVNAVPLEAKRIFTQWHTEQNQLGTLIEETRSWDLLELTLRFGSDRIDTISNITDTSGKGNIIIDPAGGFKTIDTGTGNLVDLAAPTDRKDLRTVNQWYLDDYNRELVDRDGEVYDITFELLPEKEKSFDNEYGSFESEPTDTQQTSLWYFSFEFGDIVTNRVSISSEEVADGTTDTIEVNMILTEKEARILEENASYLNTVKLRTVPDNADKLDDTSQDERQTVDITPPNGADEPIPSDTYVIKTWETEWTGNIYSFSMEIGRE